MITVNGTGYDILDQQPYLIRWNNHSHDIYNNVIPIDNSTKFNIDSDQAWHIIRNNKTFQDLNEASERLITEKLILRINDEMNNPYWYTRLSFKGVDIVDDWQEDWQDVGFFIDITSGNIVKIDYISMDNMDYSYWGDS